MANDSGFRWRTVAEVGLVSAVIYFLLGTPGLPSNLIFSSSSTDKTVSTSQVKVESLVYPEKNIECKSHNYDIHVLSTAPLIIYIDGFLSNDESEHLIDMR